MVNVKTSPPEPAEPVVTPAPAPPTEEAAPPPPPPEPWEWTPVLAVLAALVGVLALMLGSFRASNSDLWMVLATGRLLSEGNYTFGVDPFSWASQGSYWANSAWLSSLGLYQLFNSLGPSSLVIGKALLIVALACV